MKKGFEPFLNIKFNQFFSFFPATRSRTATLLRLHPNYQFFNELNRVKFSKKTDFLHVTGGVYKAN
jgi:hypothetical protein